MSKPVAAFVPRLNQVALSVVDLRLTERWFREGLGFLPAGGSRWAMRSPLAARIQAIPKARSTCWWLVDRNEFFQLELFQFEQPMARLMPADARPCDIGYTRIGVWVADFDATLRQLDALGTHPLAPVLGPRGDRRACVRNPDGVFVELMERDPLPAEVSSARRGCGAALRSVTLSVPDLQQTADFLESGLGLRETSLSLHGPEHEALWGLAGAQTQSRIFAAGGVLVEAVQYLSPQGRPRPEGYRISDQGILNVAFGARNKKDHTEVYRRSIAAGARPNCQPIHLGGAGVVYVNDPQDFSFEILWLKPGLQDRMWGFEALPIARRPSPDSHAIEQRIRIAADVDSSWAIVSDHERMASWSGFDRVQLTRSGAPERNGYNALRHMEGSPGTLQEEVIAWNPPHSYRYRVTQGSPFVCHQGEIRLHSAGPVTELVWTIRFRPRIPGTGALLRWILDRALRSGLHQRLKPLVEQEATTAHSRPRKLAA
ncbi:MAG TPA: SRPBCC family protein [Solimonas sp.]|nr:SRPBCC family protein [Solimonas sp.]